MKRCPSCQNENADSVVYCDMCGFDLAPKRAAAGGAVPAPQPVPPPAPAHPHQKRHTVFEPESAAPPAPGPRPKADFFSNPPPPRPAFDPKDPFGAAAPPPAPAPAPVAPAPAPPVAQARPKARTIVESSAGEASGGALVRAVLFEYRGPTDTGRVHPLRVGRNVIGRNEDCDVVVADGRVSSQHGFLFIRAEDATYVDVSSNGSTVNGTVVHGEQVVLQNHAVLALGGTTLVLAMVPEQVLARRSR